MEYTTKQVCAILERLNFPYAINDDDNSISVGSLEITSRINPTGQTIPPTRVSFPDNGTFLRISVFPSKFPVEHDLVALFELACFFIKDHTDRVRFEVVQANGLWVIVPYLDIPPDTALTDELYLNILSELEHDIIFEFTPAYDALISGNYNLSESKAEWLVGLEPESEYLKQTIALPALFAQLPKELLEAALLRKGRTTS